jgi:dTDP-4-amino-4,6-dideoxygalactose transaminase
MGGWMKIPFNRADLVGRELDYVAEAIQGGHISGDGPFTKRCERLLEKMLGAPRVLLTTSCTHALEMSALLLDLEPGDEVIVPSFTFVSTANAFALHGARPVFADVDPGTLNLDPSAVAEVIGPRTRAIVPVHYGGIGCDLEALSHLAASCGARLIEDNAHGFLGRRGGKLLGTSGSFSTLSFHETKNFTCGEGGALVLNDGAFAGRAEILREKGTNRSRYFRGEVDKYTWVDRGSSFVPSDMLAAFLLGQLERAVEIQEKRRRIFERYRDGLAAWGARNNVRLPVVPPECEPAWHLFYLLFPELSTRQRFLAWMKERGILCVFHYVPLHSSPMGSALGAMPGHCPVAEDVSARLARLPYYTDLTESDQCHVLEATLAFAA